MSKELEALENIRKLFIGSPIDLSQQLNIIETALKRIPELEKETEDTHKSYSMAIEKLIKDENEYIEWVQEGGYDKDEVKAFEIIKEKNVDITTLLDCHNAKEYNRWVGVRSHYSHPPLELAQEEYELLKEVLL